ncbi:unannotated protein [freshwater metagenome]|uniref:Unannotated protein n=1 Tax=freshwater metagenome TaxID=449393 RepID=A0A6J6ENJ9_9ZZZZ|nr:hypothetical protein [Actinomycetota bacterium]
MKKLAQELWHSARLLVPTNKFRAQLILLVFIAAAIPVTELLVAKLFTDLVIDGANKPLSLIVVNLLIFGLLFVATRVANYIQKNYRVKFFDRAFGADKRQKTAQGESWEWAMALEMVNILSFTVQAFVIVGFFFFLNPLMAAITLVMVLVLLEVMGRVFMFQMKTQREFVEKRRAKEVVTPAERLGSRIKSAEFATLLASFFVVALMVLLVVFSIQGVITLSSTIVFFLGLRLMNTTFSSISSALMRFARAKANSF